MVRQPLLLTMEIFRMRYVNDAPIDFTNEDWKTHTPRERARIEALERKEREKQSRRRKKSLPRLLFEWTFLIVIAVLFGYVSVYTFGQQRTNIGQSMDPTLAGGDVCLVNILAYQVGSPKVGDIVTANSDEYGGIIKRIDKINGDNIHLVSDNKEISYEFIHGTLYEIQGISTWVNINNITGVVISY